MSGPEVVTISVYVLESSNMYLEAYLDQNG